MNGGYYMLDMTGLDLSKSTAQTITGAHAAVSVAAASGKPIVLCGVKDHSPIQATVTPGSSGAFVLLFLTYSATVASPSSVTVVDLLSD